MRKFLLLNLIFLGSLYSQDYYYEKYRQKVSKDTDPTIFVIEESIMSKKYFFSLLLCKVKDLVNNENLTKIKELNITIEDQDSQIDERDDIIDDLETQIKKPPNSKLINRIVIATTSLKEDDVIEEKARSLGIDCFRGSENDVLDRYYRCAKQFEMKTIVRITADCPIIDPTIVDKVIEQFHSGDYDYATNTIIRTYPVGTDVEIFSFQSLEKSWHEAKLSSEREHVTPFLREKKSKFKIKNVENAENMSHLRWTLDMNEDLILIRKIVSKMKKRPILMNDILNLFAKEPELICINEHITKSGGTKI